MKIIVMSFGFKYGEIPAEEQPNLLFDVRFLPNPFYVDELKEKTGLDADVREYIMNADSAKRFIDKLSDLLEFVISEYAKKGKSSFTIAFGCTGGRHRSVALAEYFCGFLAGKGCNVSSLHKNI